MEEAAEEEEAGRDLRALRDELIGMFVLVCYDFLAEVSEVPLCDELFGKCVD